ncbi:MAG TPA: hypothetical protein DE179_12635 [Oceanospirillaceae bacterium]|nr:hypothetical protein [Oceanospirillaceae bacterium]
MLSTLMRYILLPILLIVLLTYAALPWWLPAAAKYSNLISAIDIEELEIGYPRYDSWHIQHLQAKSATENQRNLIDVSNIQLDYKLMDMWHGDLPNIHIGKVAFDSQLAQSSIDAAPILLLLPQRWLQTMPEQLIIERITGQVRSPDMPLGQDFSVIGKFDGTPEKAHAIAKITTTQNNDLFFEATFADDNAISATLFTKQQSAPIAKLTSQMRQQGAQLNWQGQMALNVPVAQKLLANLIPARFTLPIDQGRLMSHWQVYVPTDQQQSLPQWLQAAHGEHQFQIQVQTNTKLASDLVLDANVTHYLSKQGPDEWQINAGSQLALKPNWSNLNIQASTIDNLQLANVEMRTVAQGPVSMRLENASTNILSGQKTLVLDGVFNATLESPEAQYQVFTQLKDVRYNNTHAWRGHADLSGYYILPKNNQLLDQIPLGIQQIQALAQLDFSMTPETWKLNLAPNSKLSANQVESQQQNSQVLLFANDRLNLVNKESLELTYHTTKNQWQWNDLNLSLHPQTATGTEQATSRALGLQIQLPAGRSKFNNRPSQGYFQLHAQDTRLRGWPEFDLLGDGQFTFGGDQLEVDFTGQAQPYSKLISSQLSWDFANQHGRMQATAKAVDLVALQAQHTVNWPIQVSTGSVDYDGSWQWQAKNLSDNKHQFQLSNVNGAVQDFAITNLNGDVIVAAAEDALQSNYNLQIQALQPIAASNKLLINNVHLELTTSSPKNKGLAKAVSSLHDWQGTHFKGNFLGGEIRSQADAWTVTDLNLANLSQVLWPALEAKGKVSGTLALNDSWQIQSLNLSNTLPAQLHLAEPLGADRTGADTFNLLLQNMQVSNLEIATTAAQKNQSLPVKLRLQGASAKFNDGQVVDLNLTLDSDLTRLYAP